MYVCWLLNHVSHYEMLLIAWSTELYWAVGSEQWALDESVTQFFFEYLFLLLYYTMLDSSYGIEYFMHYVNTD